MTEPSANRPYWFGYLYWAFWTFVTYSCITHSAVAFQAAFAAMGSQSSGPLYLQTKIELLMDVFAWPVAAFFFFCAAYRLFMRQVGMKMIYTLVVFHALNVLRMGAAPYLVAFWAILSAIVISKFTEYLRLDSSLSRDDATDHIETLV